MPAVIVGPLRVGSTGASVRLVQGRLNVTVDGSFGSRTEAAVRAFQSSNGLTCDGIVGALTAAALGFPFQAGSPPAPGPRRRRRFPAGSNIFRMMQDQAREPMPPPRSWRPLLRASSPLAIGCLTRSCAWAVKCWKLSRW